MVNFDNVMCIYFIVEVITLIFAFTVINNRKESKRTLFCSCLLWAFVAGLRAYIVGNDTVGYAAFFEGTNYKGIGYGTVDMPGDTIEWGGELSRLLHLLSSSGSFFLLANIQESLLDINSQEVERQLLETMCLLELVQRL